MMARNQSEKRNSIDSLKQGQDSRLHEIDQMGTFYLKDWKTQQFDQDNSQNKPNRKKEKIRFQTIKQNSHLSSKSISLPRLKHANPSQNHLKGLRNFESLKSHKLLQPQLKRQLSTIDIIQQKLGKSELIRPKQALSFVKKENSIKKNQTQKAIQNKIKYEKNRTEESIKPQIKAKQYKIQVKANQIAEILKKFQRDYRVSINTKIKKKKDRSDLDKKIEQAVKIKIKNKNQFSESLKYYLNATKD